MLPGAVGREAEVTRHFQGADYHIVIRNPEHLEKREQRRSRADGVPV